MMTDMKRHGLVIISVLMITHGLILLAPGSNWDGALMSFMVAHGKLEAIRAWLVDSSLYPHAYLYLLLASSGEAFPYLARLVSFLALGCSAVMVYRLLIRHMALTASDALFVSLMVVVWPFLHMLMIETMVAQLVLMACFYGGWLLYLSDKAGISKRFIACLLLIISFYHGLYLLMHMAVFISLCLARPKSWLPFLRQHGWILLLPMIFFPLKIILTPVSVVFVDMDYNIPLLLRDGIPLMDGLSQTITLSLSGFFRAFVLPFYLVRQMAIDWPWMMVAMPVIALLLCACRFRFLAPREPQSYSQIIKLFISGMLMAGAVIFAHAAVDLYAHIFSPLARHASHIGIGFGFVALAMFLFLFRRLTMVKWFLSFLLITSFSLATMYAHVQWIANQAKNAAVSKHLANQWDRSDINIVLFADVPMHEGWGWRDDFFDRTTMVQNALKRYDTLGYTILLLMQPDKEVATQRMVNFLRYHDIHVDLSKARPDRLCAAVVEIGLNDLRSSTKLAMQYLYYHWLKPEGLGDWLENILQVQLVFINLRGDNAACQAKG